MLDIGWSEMAVVAVIALIIIGPKDLPRIMRFVGRWVGKARGVMREFQGTVDEMMRESELGDVKKGIEAVSNLNPVKHIKKSLDPTGDVAKAFEPPTEKPAAAINGATGAKAQPDTKAKPDTKAETKAKPDTKAKVEAKAKPETKAKVESDKVESAADSKPTAPSAGDVAAPSGDGGEAQTKTQVGA